MRKWIGIYLSLIVMQMGLYTSEYDHYAQYREYHRKAVEAYFKKDHQGWLKFNQKAIAILPDHPRTNYYIASAYALNKHKEKALYYLDRAVEMGYGYRAIEEKDFAVLKQEKGFQAIVEKIKRKKTPVIQSVEAFRLPERDLIPEGLAYDPVDDCFYISSIYKCKIVKIDPHGNISDFTKEKQDGLRPVLGMKVDPKRRILWACSEVSGMKYKGAKASENGWSGLFKYNLKDGTLIKKYTLHHKDQAHLFNDVVVATNGDVYVTDTISREIYRVRYDADRLERFYSFDGFVALNGIAISHDQNRIIFSDEGLGILSLGLKAKDLKIIRARNRSGLIGIDGLYLYRNSLIAVQNGMGVARVRRFYLDPKGEEIIRSETIDLDHPRYQIPTTGAIKGNTLYYIANSQMFRFDKQNRILPWDQLQDVMILKYRLK